MTLYPFAARIGATSSNAWMSYGQPCSRTTGGPLAGPASAYPTLRTPASICLIESNDEPVGAATAIPVSGVIVLIDISENLVAPNRAAASVMIAVPKKRRRSLLISSDIRFATSPSSACSRPPEQDTAHHDDPREEEN